jgi:hypothetical protein
MREIISNDSLIYIKKISKEILEYKNDNWENLELRLKLKIINSLLKIKNENIIINLKHRKALNLLMILYSIERKNVKYKEFNNEILNFFINFRKECNKKDNLCFSGLSEKYLSNLMEKYNNLVYNMIIKNPINKDNLFGLFNDKDEYNIFLNNSVKKVKIVNEKNTIIIKCDKNSEIVLELYLTSNKITNNLPFKYKMYLKIIENINV